MRVLDSAPRTSRSHVRSVLAVWALALATSAATPSPVAAKDGYPQRSITMVIPFDPGSQPDLLGRAVAESLRETLGRAVVVQNRVGAAGTIAVESVARAAADGYTVGFGPPGQFTVLPKLRKGFPYAIEDFEFICQTNAATFLIAAGPKSPHSSLADLIEAARRAPGTINLGTAGHATSPHLAAEWIAQHAGVRFNHVPFKNASDMIIQLANGSIDVMASTATVLSTRPDFRPLALVADQRLARHPSVPTAREQGYPLASFGAMMGLYAPKGLPQEATNALRDACGKVVGSPALKQAAEVTSSPIQHLDSKDYAARIHAESRELEGLLRKLGLMPQ
jgi:tripartite-type tricarboxylate transporter receptor subunit TctC